MSVRHYYGLAVAMAVIGGAAQSSMAATIPVQNYSFEDAYVGGSTGTYGGQGTYYSGGGSINAWQWSNNFVPNDTGLLKIDGTNPIGTAGVINPSGDGAQFAWAGSTDSSNPLLTYTGASLGNFVEGVTYTLTVAFATPNGQQILPQSYSQLNFAANGTIVGSSAHFAQAPQNAFVDQTYAYTATAADAGKTIGIVIGQSNYYSHDGIDNVRLSSNAEVPEPASIGLLGLTFGTLASRRRRRA